MLQATLLPQQELQGERALYRLRQMLWMVATTIVASGIRYVPRSSHVRTVPMINYVFRSRKGIPAPIYPCRNPSL